MPVRGEVEFPRSMRCSNYGEICSIARRSPPIYAGNRLFNTVYEGGAWLEPSLEVLFPGPLATLLSAE